MKDTLGRAWKLFQALDWRWREAVSNAALPRPQRGLRQRDPLLARASRFLRTEAVAEKGGKKPSRAFDDIREARRIHEAGGETALEIQAWLLARETFEAVAARVNLPVEVVTAYEGLFFNVADSLAAAGWILCRAINYQAERADRQHAVLLRRFAYYGGPHAVEAVLPELLHGFNCDAPRPDLSTAEGRQQQRIRVFIMYMLLPDDAETALKVSILLRGRSLGVEPAVRRVQTVAKVSAAGALDMASEVSPPAQESVHPERSTRKIHSCPARRQFG